jgi:ABC-2 type transport system permease protein
MLRVQTILMLRSPLDFTAWFLISFGGVVALSFAMQMFAPKPGEGGSLQQSAPVEVWVMFYGYLLYVFLSSSLWRIGFSVRPEQIQGTFEGLQLTPAPKFANLLARVIPLFTLTALGALLALAAAGLIFGRLPLHNPWLALLILAGSLAGTLGLGFCFAAFTLLAGESAASTGNFLEFALLFVCGMFFPFRVLPDPLRAVSGLVPLSYCVDAFRTVLIGFPPGYPELAPLEVELAIIAGFALSAPVLGAALYRAVIHHLRSSGRLGLY